MPLSWRIDPDRRIVQSTVTGVGSRADLDRLRYDLPKEPGFDPTFGHLVDLRALTGSDFTEAQMRSYAVHMPFAFSARRAVVTSTDLGFGMMHMMVTHAESQNTVDPSRWGFFTDIRAARASLLQKLGGSRS